jgi:hypothetical protein
MHVTHTDIYSLCIDNYSQSEQVFIEKYYLGNLCKKRISLFLYFLIEFYKFSLFYVIHIFHKMLLFTNFQKYSKKH